MKPIRELSEPPQGLADYLRLVGDQAYWDEFRSHDSGAAYRELVEELTSNQHGLCAYCETSISTERRQVEHVLPRSDEQRGKPLELDLSNLVACCLGVGRAEPGLAERSFADAEPAREGSEESCGQAKGSVWWTSFPEPRSLPPTPSLFTVSADGRIEVDERACRDAGFRPEDAHCSLKTLNLNARRLRHARHSQWNNLVDLSANVADETSMDTWIRTVLTPDERGRLQPFFTTSRSFFGRTGELVLAERPQNWI
ncbi:MAG: TIGR02646 family protein [Acidobacteriota bacterium]|nr:TIGR02646 family protein [Acidobacteriota bacterium]